MKNSFLIIILIFHFNLSLCQTGVLGKVLSKSDMQPINGVHIYYQNDDSTIRWIMPDQDGNFLLTMPIDSFIFIQPGLGYKSELIKLKTASIEVLIEELYFKNSEPILSTHNKLGRTEEFSSEKIFLNTERPINAVYWQNGDYKIYFSRDSLLKFLKEELKIFSLLQNSTMKELINKELSNQTNNRSRYVNGALVKALKDWAYFMINLTQSNSIVVENKKKQKINFLIRDEIMWIGNCQNCCWGGLRYTVSGISLFGLTYIIC